MKVVLTENKFSPNTVFRKNIEEQVETEDWYNNLWSMVNRFDHDGFNMTRLERLYAKKNNHVSPAIRHDSWAINYDWLLEEGQVSGTKKGSVTGPHLNHALLLERKGYDGPAKIQLERFSTKCNLVNKLLHIKPKWGLSFAVDNVDAQGNSFQMLNWQYNNTDLDVIEDKKKQMEQLLVTIDWVEYAHKMLDEKSEWLNLSQEELTDWQTDFFGIYQ